MVWCRPMDIWGVLIILVYGLMWLRVKSMCGVGLCYSGEYRWYECVVYMHMTLVEFIWFVSVTFVVYVYW